MERAQRQLLLVAVVLFAAGVAFGLFLSWDSGHQLRLVVREDYSRLFAPGDDPPSLIAPVAAELVAQNVRVARAVDFHTHSINMGVVLLLCAVLLPLLPGAGRIHTITVGLLAVGAVLYPVGLLLQFLQFHLAGEIAAATGAIFTVGSFGVLGVRLHSALRRPCIWHR